LKSRNQCFLTWPIVMVLAPASAFGIPGQQIQRPWEGSTTLCGVSFTIVKAEWVVVPDKPGGLSDICGGEIRHRLYDKLVEPRDPDHFWKISVEVFTKPFEDVKDLYEIRRENDRWFVGDGASEAPAFEIAGPSWWGLRADHIAFRGYARNGGGYVGMSDATWVVVASNTGERTAILTAGSGADDIAFPLLLNSLRFDPRPSDSPK
jgi:hypothetical protein